MCKTDAHPELSACTSSVVDGKIILTGMLIIATSPMQYALKALIYDPETDVWSESIGNLRKLVFYVLNR